MASDQDLYLAIPDFDRAEHGAETTPNLKEPPVGHSWPQVLKHRPADKRSNP